MGRMSEREGKAAWRGSKPAGLLMLIAACLTVVIACGGLAPEEAQPTASPTGTPIPTATPHPSDESSSHEEPRIPTVVLDPGHGGPEPGAMAFGLLEKESNLDLAFRVADLLEAEGIRVVLTRTADERVAELGDPDPLSFASIRYDLEARVDLANTEEADVFVSIHSNGAPFHPEIRGLEVWYNELRPFADRNLRLATLLHEEVLAELAEAGYEVEDRGVLPDTCFTVFEQRCYQLFLLDNERELTREEVIAHDSDPEDLGFAPGQESIMTPATQMPGALVELLFITNPEDAAILQDETARDAMARGMAQAILRFLAES
jgi:N-acetylmuramoyl-L-alanine amidase